MMRKKRKRGGPPACSCSSPAAPPPESRGAAWTGMGRAAPSCASAASAARAEVQQRPRRRRPRPRPPPLPALVLLFSLGLLLHTADCQLQTPCRIQKCTTDFVSLTSHLTSSIDGFDLEFCKALRAYSACTYRNSKVCRGNLVYHSAVLGISDLMSQRNCSKDGPTSSTNPEVTHDPCNYIGRQGAREHRGGEQTPPTYFFCGLFGDPHLRTFKDHFQTCKVEGAWPLIDNNYLSVQVTNVPVVPGSSATATNKITIIFKSYQDCTDQKVYQAVTDDLPAAFVDGTTSGGDGDTKSLRIVERVSGKSVEMHARYIGTTVFVRQLGRYLTLAIRMPEELAMAYEESQDLQLCVNGCPLSERIDDSGHLPLPVMGQLLPPGASSQSRSVYTLESATTKCHEKMLLKDIYFYSCVFDLLTTGDANFTAAAHSALQDVEALHPKKERWHIFPSNGGRGGGSDSCLTFGLVCLMLVVFL
ncbi:repulsive guidance molecule B [Varanus komodoensis]|uniref:Repulsive guidance molecule BMP co-receptor b n=1 Tax=Varanus komodoensis TaxID=61221 RepID=A0A8D2JCI7_VARKO|nr:repulsive guidance molecule B [Varanus komodoensis]